MGISDLTGPYFPIGEAKAREMLDGYMEEVGLQTQSPQVEWNGYAVIYAYNPVIDQYCPTFEISHEFLINGEHKVWVGVAHGTVVDEPQIEWIAGKNAWIARENPTDEEIDSLVYQRTKISDE